MALVPLTLLSGTFFLVEVYPPALRWLVELSPLYHGVVIERALCLGDVSWSLLWHVAALLAMGAVGLAVTRRRLAKLLLKEPVSRLRRRAPAGCPAAARWL